MGQLAIQVIAGVLIAAIVGWFGIGQSAKVFHVRGVTGNPVKKWKWCMAIGIAMMFAGLAWAGSATSGSKGSSLADPAAAPGMSLAGLGLLVFLVGKFFAWLNKG